MKFYPLTSSTLDEDQLTREYAGSHAIGKLRLGKSRLYFRTGRKIYYIAYGDVQRCFRRVMLVPARLCCGNGDLEVEHLVVCGAEGELAQIQLPGARAAKVLMDELKERIPEAEFGCPKASATP